MQIIIICNNIIENNLIYNDLNLPESKIRLPIINKLKDTAKNIALLSLLTDTNAIYSSQNASNMLFAKTLAKRINKDVYSSDKFADEKIGNLKNQDLKDVYFMQEHDFNIRLTDGESLNEVGKRVNDEIEHIVNLSNLKKVVIFTHKRAFLGYLINILQPSYTLDDNLVIEYDDNVIYDNSKNDIIELVYTIDNVVYELDQEANYNIQAMKEEVLQEEEQAKIEEYNEILNEDLGVDYENKSSDSEE